MAADLRTAEHRSHQVPVARATEPRATQPEQEMRVSSDTDEGRDVADVVDEVKRLEEEGEIAADYLEELLDIADLDGDIEIDVEHGRSAVEIVAESGGTRSLRRLVGPDGEVLEALQELTRLAVQTKTGERSRLMLDVAGYRKGRRAELTSAAQIAVEQVRSSGEALALEPMNSFERKVVHDAVAAAGLVSDSEGVDPNRRVVVRPA
jgi:spoIIIJ-associated protein